MSEVADLVIDAQAIGEFYEGSEAASGDEQELLNVRNVDGAVDYSGIDEDSGNLALANTEIESSPWSFLVRCGINLVLPFINGMMMGFGEIFAHELCFRSGRQFVGVRVVSQAQRSKYIAANKDSVLVRN